MWSGYNKRSSFKHCEPSQLPLGGFFFCRFSNLTDPAHFVILSGETASLREAVSQSKDPYKLFDGGERRIFVTIAFESPRFSTYGMAIGVLRLRGKFAKRTFHCAQDDSCSDLFKRLLHFHRHQVPICFSAGFKVRNHRTVRPIAGKFVCSDQQQ
jgi:hypothetical protein